MFVRCGGCRAILDGVRTPSDFDLAASAPPDLLPLEEGEDGLPDWVVATIDQSGWTKDKLSCPRCGHRVGAFDFLSAGGRKGGYQMPSVYLVRSRVDLPFDVDCLKKEKQVPREEDSAANPSEQGVGEPERQASNKQQSYTMPTESLASVKEPSDKLELEASSENRALGSSSSLRPASPRAPRSSSSSLSSRSSSESAKSSETSSEERDVGSTSENQGSTNCWTSEASLSHQGNRRRAKKKNTKEAREKAILSADESDFDEEELSCAVCLGLLHEPHKVKPCNHTFCGPCLKRAASKNPLTTNCPYCRSKISYCELDKELTAHILSLYPALYAKRHNVERRRSADCGLVLPWTPGWRNLVAGRGLGGNKFRDQSFSGKFRRVMRVLPFYVPSFIRGNVVNLVALIVMVTLLDMTPRLLKSLLPQELFERALPHPHEMCQVPDHKGFSAPKKQAEAFRQLLSSIHETDVPWSNYPTPFDASLYNVFSFVTLGTLLVSNMVLLYQNGRFSFSYQVVGAAEANCRWDLAYMGLFVGITVMLLMSYVTPTEVSDLPPYTGSGEEIHDLMSLSKAPLLSRWFRVAYNILSIMIMFTFLAVGLCCASRHLDDLDDEDEA